MDFLNDYMGFLARFLTLVVVLGFPLLVLALLRRKTPQRGELQVRRLNGFYRDLSDQLQQAILPAKAWRRLQKQKVESADQVLGELALRRRVFVLDFQGDIQAGATEHLRHEITAILGLVCRDDEVVVRLESGGGLVHAYGLAASQLVRLREAGVPLTICVDKVAASGGYMMACVADRIVSAPFAVLGSIGVVAQLPNLHRFLKKRDVDVELFTAGEYKRTVTVLGENTSKGRAKFQQDLDRTHDLFKGFVTRYRSALDMDKLGTGEVWLGEEALAHGLVDELCTSDEYLCRCVQNADVLHVRYQLRRQLGERLAGTAAQIVDRAILVTWERLNQQRLGE